LSANAILAV